MITSNSMHSSKSKYLFFPSAANLVVCLSSYNGLNFTGGNWEKSLEFEMLFVDINIYKNKNDSYPIITTERPPKGSVALSGMACFNLSSI